MDPAQPAPAGRSSGPMSLLHALQSLVADVQGQVSDRVHLLALEMKRAGLALAEMVALVVASAVLALTAWLALWIGLAAGLIQWGLGWGWVLLIVLVLNLGAAALALARLRTLAHLLSLPATKRHLTVAPAPVASSPHHEPNAQQHQPVAP